MGFLGFIGDTLSVCDVQIQGTSYVTPVIEKPALIGLWYLIGMHGLPNH